MDQLRPESCDPEKQQLKNSSACRNAWKLSHVSISPCQGTSEGGAGCIHPSQMFSSGWGWRSTEFGSYWVATMIRNVVRYSLGDFLDANFLHRDSSGISSSHGNGDPLCPSFLVNALWVRCWWHQCFFSIALSVLTHHCLRVLIWRYFFLPLKPPPIIIWH